MSDYAEWVAYIGPHYLDYDWTVHQVGDVENLGYSTQLSLQLSAGATSAAVSSSAAFAASGGLWISGAGTGQGLEYVSYTSKGTGAFSGLVREPAIERYHNGVHSPSASVRQFIQITGDNGALQFDGELDDYSKLVAIWTASISGKRYQQALRNGHVVVIQRRTSPGGSLSNALVGFVSNPEVIDNAKREAEWTLPIVSIAGILSNTRTSPVRAGSFNIASSGTASASSTLVDTYAEIGKGDYTAANPDLSAGSAIDDQYASLWIGDRFHGTDNPPASNSDPENNDALRFTQFYLNPPAGSVPGSRWFEMTRITQGNIQGLSLHAANGGTGTIDWIFGGPGEVDAGSHLIFCEDQAVFETLHPSAEYAAIYEFAAFFGELPPSGGEVWLRLGELNIWLSLVRWGDGNGYVNHEDAPDQDWSGPAVTAPGAGETMRYIYTPSSPSVAADYWVTDDVYHPGYSLDASESSWFIVDLPGMGLLLESDITNSSPGNGELLGIVDDAGNGNTGGLDASGVLQIGTEQIAYSSKTEGGVYVATGGRGYGSTTAASHDAGDAIQIVDGGIATDAPPISLVTLRWSGTVKGKNVVMYTSKYPGNVRNPDADNWLNDWEGFNTITNNSSAVVNSYLSPSRRIKHLVVLMSTMTVAPARARLSEVEMFLDESKYGSDTALPADSTAGAVIQKIVVDAGFPSSAVVHSGTPQLDKVNTAADFAWPIIADFADFAGVKIVVGRDSRISVSASTLWSASQSAASSWHRTNTRQIRKNWVDGSSVSQVVIRWRSPDGTDGGVARFPSTPTTTGAPQEYDDLIYANSSAALTAAQRRYYATRYPSTLLVDCSAQQWNIDPGLFHDYIWQFDPGEPEMQAVCVVTAVHHRIERRRTTSAIELAEIQHVSNY